MTEIKPQITIGPENVSFIKQRKGSELEFINLIFPLTTCIKFTHRALTQSPNMPDKVKRVKRGE